MGFVRRLTGKTAANAALTAGNIQAESAREAQSATEAARERGLGFLDPFQAIGQQGLDQAGFLTDPTAQFEFLQQNPLFQLALQNANTQTQNQAASRGRLSAGDTLQDLSNNVLLSASPLISGQKQSIMDLLGLGSNIAGSQANIATGSSANIADLITGAGAARAGGLVGAENARSQGINNILNIAGLTASTPIAEDSLAGRAFSLGGAA